MKKTIVPIIFIVIMASLGSYYLYKYNNYPMQKVVHCYLIEKGEDKPWYEIFYTIEKEKIVNRVEISRSNYAIDDDSFEKLRERWESYNKYKGYITSSWQNEDSSFGISYFDFKNLTDEEYTEIWYQDPDSDNYHVPFYIEDATKINDDFIKKNRENGWVCY